VTDFGIARSSDVESVTLTGTVMGTSEYISPEQARGEAVDFRSDVYSLGAILYELCTGDVPFPGENPVSVAMRHLHEPVPSARERRRDVPSRLDAAIRRAMAKDPAERFDSMDELIAELHACLRALGDGEDTIILPPPVRARRERRGARRLGRAVLLSLVALLLVGAAAVGAFALAGIFDSDDDGGGAAAGSPISLQGLRGHDPFGDNGAEHDAEAALATDTDRSTYWTTETYNSGLQKDGVGLLLDAGERVDPSRFLVTTDTPGFKAEIRAGSSDGRFEPVSPNRIVNGTTAFPIETDGARYFVVWITELQPGSEVAARINEVRARGE
jgi:eukaryotic-like serine/threonine-protein kinase